MTDFFIKDKAETLLANGYEPVPIDVGHKAPLMKGWSRIDITPEVVGGWVANGQANKYVGARCGQVVGLDIDIDDPEVSAFVRADAEFMLGSALVRFGRPGRALLVYRIDGDEGRKHKVSWLDRSGLKHDVEVLQRGQQFVAFGIHPDTREPYRWESGDPTTVPVSDLSAVSERDVVDWLKGVTARVCDKFGWHVVEAGAVDPDERFLMTYRPAVSIKAMTPEQRVSHEALKNLDRWVPELFPAARPYQDGYRVSSSDLGRDLQEDLSLVPAGIQDFGEETGLTPLQVVERWRGEDGALEWLAERVGVDMTAQAESAAEEAVKDAPGQVWLKRMEEAQDEERLKRVCEGVRSAALSDLDRERLAQVLKRRYSDITGISVGIAAARKQLKPKRKVERPVGGHWSDGWYYTTHNDKFYLYGSRQWVSCAGFEALYRRNMPIREDGGRDSAVRFVMDDLQLPVVEIGMYCPPFGERFNASGRECVNTFMPSSIPEAAEVADPQVVQVLKQHLINIAGKHAIALLDWLAHNVQYPGRKIRYAPLIKGIEGDGKSLLLTMLACGLGEANVRMAGPDTVISSFNGYAEGSCVVGLEELRIVGHNRYEVANALKPLITNDTVDIHKKGVDAYNAINVSNYIAFTNYADALPLTETDRRWWVLFTEWSSASEMAKAVGMPLPDYFDRIHAALGDPASVRRFLLDHPISKDFNPNGRAPMTEAKLSMVRGDVNDNDELLQRRIELGGVGIGEKAIATDCLRTAPTFDDEEWIEELPTGNTLAKALRNLGWVKYPKPIKWQGKTRKVWVKGMSLSDNDAVREALGTSRAGDDVPF